MSLMDVDTEFDCVWSVSTVRPEGEGVCCLRLFVFLFYPSRPVVDADSWFLPCSQFFLLPIPVQSVVTMK